MGNTKPYLGTAESEAYRLTSSQAIASVRYPCGTHMQDGHIAGYQIVGDGGAQAQASLTVDR